MGIKILTGESMRRQCSAAREPPEIAMQGIEKFIQGRELDFSAGWARYAEPMTAGGGWWILAPSNLTECTKGMSISQRQCLR
jgi:hypothetical protein